MAGDPFEGLNAAEWRKALAGVEGDIQKMRGEAAALDSELRSGKKSISDIKAEGRRGARIGAAATPAAEDAAGRRAVSNAKRVADQEARAAAARQASLRSMERLSRTRVGPLALPGGGQILPPGGATRQLPPGPRSPLLLGPGSGTYPRGIKDPDAEAALRRQAEQARLVADQEQRALAARNQSVVAMQRLAATRPGNLALAGGGGVLLAADDKGRTAQQALNDRKTAINDVARAESRAGAVIGRQTSNMQRNQAVFAASSREMRKFGALTTEFISAAGRGAVSVRELGFQVSSTIGKFGGWLVAGSAVYTAFGAITAVGKGAIDAQSGVSQLQRVVNDLDAGEATESFRDLAREFNLPVGEVTSASFEMGKVFHDQNQAMEATRTILSAVKVGELDVATSSRYLTSIVAGFNLPAAEMATVFDQINQAQNQFGIRIEDTLAGLAKASGTFRAAGGDISTLLALITTARRATGQTGEVIGTAFARAPNFLRRQDSRATLRSFGIDPEQDITAIMDSAFRKAQSLGGKKVQELAAAIFGPQYGARIGTPLLQQFELFQKVTSETSPEASKGSAQKELQSVLGQTTEEIAKVVIQLETLGSELADAGFLAPFFGLLKLLNGVLGAANSILGVFNDLPKPLRLAVATFAQIAGFIALMRRLNVGESFGGRGGGVLGTLFTRKNQEAFRYREALTGQRDVLAREAESSAQTAVRRSIDVDAAKATLAQETAALRTLEAREARKEVGAAEAVKEQKQRIVSAEGGLSAARNAELDAMTKNQSILRQSLLLEGQMAQTSKRMTDAQARTLAARYGVLIPGSVDPNLKQAALLARAGDIQGTLSPLEAAPLGFQSLRPDDRGRFQKQGELLRQNFAQYGLIGGTLATANEGVKAGAAKARVQLAKLNRASIGAAARRFATSARGFGRDLFGMLNPIDLAIIGGFIILDAFINGQKQVADTAKAIKALGDSDSAEAFQASADELRASIGERGGFGDTAALFGPIQAADEQLAEIGEQEEARTRQIISLLKTGQSTDTSFLYSEDFQKYGIDAAKALFEDGAIGAQALARRANRLVETVRGAQNLSDEQEAEAISAIRTTLLQTKGYNATFEQIAALTNEDLTARITTYADAVGSGIGTVRQRQTLLRDALIFTADRIGSNKPEDLSAMSQALDTAIGAITDSAKAELDRSLLFARGQGERNAAYDAYFRATSPRQIRGQTNNLIQQQREKLRQNQQVVRALRQDLGETSPAEAFQKDLSFGPRMGAVIAELRARGKDSKQIREAIKSLRKGQKEAVERVKQIQEEERLQKFEEGQELRQARGELRAGRAAEGLPALRVQLQVMGQIVERAIQKYTRNSKEVIDLLNEQQALRDQIVQEQLNLVQARGEFRAAAFSGEGDEVRRARVELQSLYSQLAFMQSNRQQFSAAEILGLQTQIREAEIQIAEDVAQRAEDLKLAMFDIRVARAQAGGNDVRAARAELAKAQYELRNADDPVARRQARAEVISRRASLRDSIYQREIDDIEFSADIGKLTLQQQISQYQNLLNTLDLTREQRRDLRRKIHQLKQDAAQATDDFELRVGDIKLPTIYDIRRAIQGGGGGGNGNNVVDQSTSNVTVNVNGGDTNEVLSAFDRALNRHNKNARRSAGRRP